MRGGCAHHKALETRLDADRYHGHPSHGDHVGGVRRTEADIYGRVVAPHDKSTKIANADARVNEGDAVKVGISPEGCWKRRATH